MIVTPTRSKRSIPTSSKVSLLPSPFGVNTFGINNLLDSMTIVATAEEQFVGFNTSHIVYGYSYVPGLNDGASVIVPSGFIVNPRLLGVPGVKVTSSKLIGLPLYLSLTNTLGVVPNSLLHSTVYVSSSAI